MDVYFLINQSVMLGR